MASCSDDDEDDDVVVLEFNFLSTQSSNPSSSEEPGCESSGGFDLGEVSRRQGWVGDGWCSWWAGRETIMSYWRGKGVAGVVE